MRLTCLGAAATAERVLFGQVAGAAWQGVREAGVCGVRPAGQLALNQPFLFFFAALQLFAGQKALRAEDIADAPPDAGDSSSDEEEEGSDAEEEGSDDGGSSSSSDDGEDGSSSSDEGEEGAAARGRRGGSPLQQVVHAADGRVRRRALFGDCSVPVQASSGDDDSDASGSEGSDGEEEEGSSSGGESDDSEGLGAAARWKSNLLDRAAALFSTRGADLQSYIYGRRATADVRRAEPAGCGSVVVAFSRLADRLAGFRDHGFPLSPRLTAGPTLVSLASVPLQGAASSRQLVDGELGGGGSDSDDDDLFKPRRKAEGAPSCWAVPA